MTLPYRILQIKGGNPMKRILSMLFALTLVFALAPAVSADVLSPIGIVASIIDLKTVLIAVAVVAVVSALFLWFTRKK
jgi:hypothetical protein